VRHVITDQIVSPKQASQIELVPNRDVLQRRMAEFLAGQPDGGVLLAPPVSIFSVWVEDTAVRLRQLSAQAVPASQDAYAGLLAWSRNAASGSPDSGYTFELNAARQAREADRLLRHWQFEGEAPWLNEEFYRRRQRIHAGMEAAGIYSPEDWLGDLARLLESESTLPLTLPRKISLEGFIELTPLECRLISALEGRGVVISQGKSEVEDSRVEVLVFATPEDELQAAAAWAKARFESGARSLCIVAGPGVAESGPAARRIRQTLAATFHPAEAAALSDSLVSEFHISAAGRLLHSRVIRSALLLLRLSLAESGHKHDFASISQWLMSPHWAAAKEEGADRALLELRLRERGLFRLSLADVLERIRAEGQKERLPEMVKKLEALPSLKIPASPAEYFHDVLSLWGWPGSHVAEFSEPQQAFLSLLERLAGLAVESCDGALRLLEAMCLEISNSFGGGPLSPVQVLSPEVAAGGHFDGIWVCQMDDANWPPPISPNPYLPAELRSRIPRMNPEGQFDYYRNLTRMLCATAPVVRLSWSRDAGQGPRNMSGLLEGREVREADPAPPVRLSTAIWPEARRDADSGALPGMIAIDDEIGVPFPEKESLELPGGSDFFRLQAACPLWAYMKHRLGAEFPAMPSLMADPAFRGTLLHRALRELYARCSPGSALPRADDIAPAVGVTLSESRVRERLTATGLLAEAGRLKRALADWLELDGSREGFEVELLEQAYSLTLGRAVIRIRVDRIDRLSDGRCFLIDYKSSLGGRSRALKWLWTRIQEPQLPLYAVLLEASGEAETGGISIASVRAGQCGYDGISDDSVSTARGIRVAGETSGAVKSWDWATLKAHWRSQSEMLGDEILSGRADNRVYDVDAIRFCDIALILRHEEAAWLEDREDDQDAG